MIPLLPLLTSKWGLRISAGVLVLTALFFWGRAQKNAGKEEGKQEAAQETKESLEQMRQADRAQTQQQLEGLRELIDQYKEAFNESQQRQAQLAQANALLSQQRQTVAEGVTKLPDSELHSYIVQQLGLRPVGDRAQGYSFAEERELAKCVSDRPLCIQQVEKQRQQIAELQEGQRTQGEQLKAQQQRFDVLVGYTDRVEGYYTTLWNLFPKKKRSAKCLWLFRCGKEKPLPTPEPITLTNPVKQGGTP